MIPWWFITPAGAVDLVLPLSWIVGPLNELGEPCPWPWDPQQLVGAPLGQYHCGYCGAMVIAGMHHIDYRGIDDWAPEPATTATRATCRVCGGGCQWQDCPTGGWWIHDEHPADDHDAEPDAQAQAALGR